MSRDRVILHTYNTYQLDNFFQLFTNRDRILPFSFPSQTFAPKNWKTVQAVELKREYLD